MENEVETRESSETYEMTRSSDPESICYLVEENGERVGVVLSWEDYQALRAVQPDDPELLTGLSDTEVEILADSMLAPRLQERLGRLLQLNRENLLSAEEEQEIDRLLKLVDQMNILKARAMYTLHRRRETITE